MWEQPCINKCNPLFEIKGSACQHTARYHRNTSLIHTALSVLESACFRCSVNASLCEKGYRVFPVVYWKKGGVLFAWKFIKMYFMGYNRSLHTRAELSCSKNKIWNHFVVCGIPCGKLHAWPMKSFALYDVTSRLPARGRKWHNIIWKMC